jgi:hypothetical protein
MPSSKRIGRHPLSPLNRRAAWSLVLLCCVMAAGTVGMKALTGWDWPEAFYFTAMLATTQGPPLEPSGVPAKLFAAFFAFVSVGSLLTAMTGILGPLMGYYMHRGLSYAERELRKLEETLEQGEGG